LKSAEIRSEADPETRADRLPSPVDNHNSVPPEYYDDSFRSTAESSDNEATARQGLINQDNRLPIVMKPRPNAIETKEKASSLLMQIVPYVPRSDQQTLPPSYTDRNNLGLIPNPRIDDVSNSVRLLLDKWTQSGSTAIPSALLATPKAMNANDPVGIRPGTPDFSRDFPPPDGYHNEPWNRENLPHGHIPRIRRRLPHDVWRPFQNRSENWEMHRGVFLLTALRMSGGGITYSKRTLYEQIFYLDEEEYYRFALVPHKLMDNENSSIFTDLPKGVVCEEALRLLGLKYTETRFCYSVEEDLDLVGAFFLLFLAANVHRSKLKIWLA
jgi:hypothetical protein